MLRLRPFRTPDAKERNTQLQEKAGLILKWKYIKNRGFHHYARSLLLV